MRIRFPRPFRHEHPPIQNVNALVEEHSSASERMADAVTRLVGSWPFIATQSVLLALWITFNVLAWARAWDPYPFILLNLALSFQAAYTAPIIMMSQNRQAQRDRLEARNDFELNRKAEEEIRAVLEHLAAQDTALQEILQRLNEGNGA